MISYQALEDLIGDLSTPDDMRRSEDELDAFFDWRTAKVSTQQAKTEEKMASTEGCLSACPTTNFRRTMLCCLMDKAAEDLHWMRSRITDEWFRYTQTDEDIDFLIDKFDNVSEMISLMLHEFFEMQFGKKAAQS